MQGPRPEPSQPFDAPPPRKRRLPILVRHAISLLVVFVLAIPASVYIGTAIYRNAQLEKLESPDEHTFDEGLAYVYANASEDERVRDAAFEQVAELEPPRARRLVMALASGKDDDEPVTGDVYPAFGDVVGRLEVQSALGFYEDFLKVPGADPDKTTGQMLSNLAPKDDAELLLAVAYLDGQLIWTKDAVPRDLWLRWLLVLSNSSAEVAQHQAVRKLGELPDDLDDPRVVEALTRLSGSPHASVRAQVLSASAGYARIAKDPTDYEQIIFKLGGDANNTIARRAWMIVGHLNPLSGYAVNWKEADPFVAEAVLWASVKTNPENPKAAIDAVVGGELVSQGLLALSATSNVSLLELQHEREAGDLIGQSRPDPDFNQAWRCILAIHPESGWAGYWLENLWQYHRFQPSPIWNDTEASLYRDFYFTLFCAMTYRINAFSPPKDYELSPEELQLAQLAAIEGYLIAKPKSPNPLRVPEAAIARLIGAAGGAYPVAPEQIAAQIDIATPWVSDLMTAALTSEDASGLSKAMRSGITPLERSAVIASGITRSRPELIAINEAFLRKHPDLTDDQLHSMSDEALAELGLKRIDALAALLDAAKNAPASAGRQNEVKLLKLALWMRGDLGDDFTPKAEAMLFDKQLPTSTVLMCLLHMRRPIALEYLFGDTVTHPPGYLQELFIAERWWHVFRRFVDTSGLTLWLWGDPAAQAFQIEAMRQWYAVNRWRIEGGWWPEPAGS
ncbi:MAG: hypothetical protein ACE37H_08455 [Phycisphaeraceae bacterium]